MLENKFLEQLENIEYKGCGFLINEKLNDLSKVVYFDKEDFGFHDLKEILIGIKEYYEPDFLKNNNVIGINISETKLHLYYIENFAHCYDSMSSLDFFFDIK